MHKEEQISRMRKLGKAHGTILQELKQATKPGIRKKQLEELFIMLLSKFSSGIPGIKSACKGYQPQGYKTPYPTNLCVARNFEAIHVPADNAIIEEGDLITIDLVLTDGLVYTDSALSFIVGQTNNSTRTKLLKTSYNALYQAINKIRAGIKLGIVSSTIFSIVQRAGFDVLKDYGGHGIGTQMWEEPFIPNYGSPTSGPTLKEGDTLAIEPLVTAGTDKLAHINEWATRTADYSDFVQVEHTVLVLANGFEILTKA